MDPRFVKNVEIRIFKILPLLKPTDRERIARQVIDSQNSITAAALSIVLVIGAVCVCYATGASKPPSASGILPQMISYLKGGSDENFCGPLNGVKFIISSTAVCILFATQLSKLSLTLSDQWRDKSIQFIFVISSIFLICTFFFWSMSQTNCLYLGMFAVWIPFFGPFRFGFRVPRAVDYRVLALSAILLSILPFLFLSLDLSAIQNPDPFYPQEIQSHYKWVIGYADQLATGQKLFAEVVPRYGVLIQLFAAALQHFFGTWSLGTYVQAVKISEIIYILSTFYIFKKFARGYRLPFFLAFMLVLPWHHLNQESLFWPNLSAIRYLGFPFTFLGMWQLRKLKPRSASLAAGFIGSIALLLNLETGIACCFALLAFVTYYFAFPMSSHPRRFVSLITFFFLGSMVPVLLLVGVCLITGGYVPDFGRYFFWLGYWSHSMAVGVQNVPAKFDPVAITMIVHACYVILRLSIKNHLPNNFHNSVRFAACVSIIVWFAYYIQRPSGWSLETEFFAYGILVIDVARIFSLATIRPIHRFEPTTVLGLLLSVIIVPQVIYGIGFASFTYVPGLKQLSRGPSEKTAYKLSGVFMQRDVALALQEKANYLKQHSSNGVAPYLTVQSFLIPKMSGIRSTFLFDDLFCGTLFESDLANRIDNIQKNGPPTLLIDAPDSILCKRSPARLTFINQLRSGISKQYIFVESACGWETWRRLPST